jgi:hypothetical protein
LDVAGAWYKPRVGEEVSGVGPEELIRRRARTEREIAPGLTRLLGEREA